MFSLDNLPDVVYDRIPAKVFCLVAKADPDTTHIPKVFGVAFFQKAVGAPACASCVVADATNPEAELCEADIERFFNAVFDGSKSVFLCGSCVVA